MSIYLYCQECKSNNDIGAKVCKKCGKTFPATGRKYRIRVKLAGNTVNKFTHSLVIAREIEAAIKGDLARGKYEIHVKKKVLTLDELFEKYITWAKNNKKSWFDDESRYITNIQPVFGHKRLDQITSWDIERFKSNLKSKNTRRGKPYAPQTVKHHIVIIRRLFNIAKKWGLFKGDNPVSRVSMPKVDNQRIRFLSESELKALLDTLDKWPCQEAADFIRFALLTGFRQGELLKLKWESIDFENGYVTHVHPKGGKTDTIPISSQAMDVLRLRPRVSEYVFPGKNGGRRYDFKGPWTRICKAAGITDLRFHDLRHNFASQLVSSGVDLAIVQKLLSHKNMITTMKYAHLAPGAVKDAAKLSGEIVTHHAEAEVIEINIVKGA